MQFSSQKEQWRKERKEMDAIRAEQAKLERDRSEEFQRRDYEARRRAKTPRPSRMERVSRPKKRDLGELPHYQPYSSSGSSSSGKQSAAELFDLKKKGGDPYLPLTQEEQHGNQQPPLQKSPTSSIDDRIESANATAIATRRKAPISSSSSSSSSVGSEGGPDPYDVEARFKARVQASGVKRKKAQLQDSLPPYRDSNVPVSGPTPPTTIALRPEKVTYPDTDDPLGRRIKRKLNVKDGLIPVDTPAVEASVTPILPDMKALPPPPSSTPPSAVKEPIKKVPEETPPPAVVDYAPPPLQEKTPTILPPGTQITPAIRKRLAPEFQATGAPILDDKDPDPNEQPRKRPKLELPVDRIGQDAAGKEKVEEMKGLPKSNYPGPPGLPNEGTLTTNAVVPPSDPTTFGEDPSGQIAANFEAPEGEKPRPPPDPLPETTPAPTGNATTDDDGDEEMAGGVNPEKIADDVIAANAAPSKPVVEGAPIKDDNVAIRDDDDKGKEEEVEGDEEMPQQTPVSDLPPEEMEAETPPAPPPEVPEEEMPEQPPVSDLPPEEMEGESTADQPSPPDPPTEAELQQDDEERMNAAKTELADEFKAQALGNLKTDLHIEDWDKLLADADRALTKHNELSLQKNRAGKTIFQFLKEANKPDLPPNLVDQLGASIKNLKAFLVHKNKGVKAVNALGKEIIEKGYNEMKELDTEGQGLSTHAEDLKIRIQSITDYVSSQIAQELEDYNVKIPQEIANETWDYNNYLKQVEKHLDEFYKQIAMSDTDKALVGVSKGIKEMTGSMNESLKELVNQSRGGGRGRGGGKAPKAPYPSGAPDKPTALGQLRRPEPTESPPTQLSTFPANLPSKPNITIVEPPPPTSFSPEGVEASSTLDGYAGPYEPLYMQNEHYYPLPYDGKKLEFWKASRMRGGKKDLKFPHYLSRVSGSMDFTRLRKKQLPKSQNGVSIPNRYIQNFIESYGAPS